MDLSDPQLQLNDANINKYRTAGHIASKAINMLVSSAKPNSRVMDLCKLGDQFIIDEVSKVYSKIEHKGIAFPTCININNVGGYFTTTCDDTVVLKDNDLVKIEIGVHIDGYPALQVFTCIIDGETDKPTKLSDKGRVSIACSEASKEILKIMKPGNKNTDVVKILEKVAKKYNCSLPIIGDEGIAPTTSYQISRNIIDGYNDDSDEYIHQLILCRDNEEVYGYKLAEEEFLEDEVYAIDITMCSGTGKLNRMTDYVNIYRRDHRHKCNLKLKASRHTLNIFNGMWFPLNTDNNRDNKFRLGLKECIRKDLLVPYIPVSVKEDYVIGRIKFTVIVKNKPILITGRSMDKQINKFS